MDPEQGTLLLQLADMKVSTAWNMYLMVTTQMRLAGEDIDDKEMETEEKMLREGIKMRFNIKDYITGNFTTKPKKKTIRISGKTFGLDEWYREVEERERLMKARVLDSFADRDSFRPEKEEDE